MPQTSLLPQQTTFDSPFRCNTIVDYILLGLCPEHQKLHPFSFVIVDPNLVSFTIAKTRSGGVSSSRNVLTVKQIIQREIYSDFDNLHVSQSTLSPTVLEAKSAAGEEITPQPGSKKRRIYMSPTLSQAVDNTRPARSIVSEYQAPFPMYKKELTSDNIVRFIKGGPQSFISLPNLLRVSADSALFTHMYYLSCNINKEYAQVIESFNAAEHEAAVAADALLDIDLDIKIATQPDRPTGVGR